MFLFKDPPGHSRPRAAPQARSHVAPRGSTTPPPPPPPTPRKKQPRTRLPSSERLQLRAVGDEPCRLPRDGAFFKICQLRFALEGVPHRPQRLGIHRLLTGAVNTKTLRLAWGVRRMPLSFARCAPDIIRAALGVILRVNSLRE